MVCLIPRCWKSDPVVPILPWQLWTVEAIAAMVVGSLSPRVLIRAMILRRGPEFDGVINNIEAVLTPSARDSVPYYDRKMNLPFWGGFARRLGRAPFWY